MIIVEEGNYCTGCQAGYFLNKEGDRHITERDAPISYCTRHIFKGPSLQQKVQSALRNIQVSWHVCASEANESPEIPVGTPCDDCMAIISAHMIDIFGKRQHEDNMEV